MPFEIVRNDITKIEADIIVNAANSSLMMGGGVCGAIFKSAGVINLTLACRKIGHCDTGEAVITKGYKLLAKYIIHTVGPVWKDGNQNEEKLLKSCYTKSLQLAKGNGCTTIAFPLISSGIYGYPKADAIHIATSAINDFLLENEMMVYLVVYDKTDMVI